MFAASRNIFDFDVLSDKEVHCLRRVQIQCTICCPSELPMAATAPCVAEALLFCDCNSMVKTTRYLHNLVLCQAVDQLGGICKRYIVN